MYVALILTVATIFGIILIFTSMKKWV
jgi:hypothetical protein